MKPYRDLIKIAHWTIGYAEEAVQDLNLISATAQDSTKEAAMNWHGFESFKAYAWSSVITANLLLMARHLLR